MSLEALETGSSLKRIVRVWYALLGGIGAWMVHLLVESSLVRYGCNVGGIDWVMHLVTAVTAAATLLAMWLSWQLVRDGRTEPADEDTPGGRFHFIGLLGLLFGAINLALILIEGVYVGFVPHCRG